MFWGASLLICMSGVNIFHHHQGATKQSASRFHRSCQERGNAHTFDSLQLPNCFTSGEKTQHTRTDASCHIPFGVIILCSCCVFPSLFHHSCLAQTLYIKLLRFLFSFSKIFVILFTCCVSLSGAVHFCTPEGIHWTVLMERGS